MKAVFFNSPTLKVNKALEKLNAAQKLLNSPPLNSTDPISVKNLIRELQRKDAFKEPLIKTDAAHLNTQNINNLHKAWGLLIESYIEHIRATSTPKELWRQDENEAARLLNKTPDSTENPSDYMLSQGWECRGIQLGLIFEQPITEAHTEKYLSGGHYFYPAHSSDEIKLVELWRIVTQKHFTNCPVPETLKRIETFSFPGFVSVDTRTTTFYDASTRTLCDLTYINNEDSHEGFIVRKEPVPQALEVKLLAKRLSNCHVVIVREVNTEKVWVSHVHPSEVRQTSMSPFAELRPTPAYIQFSDTFEGHRNLHCPHGEIDILVIDRYGAFDEKQLRKRLSKDCTVRNFSVYRYGEKELGNNDYHVCYDLATNTVFVASKNPNKKTIEITHAFKSSTLGFQL